MSKKFNRHPCRNSACTRMAGDTAYCLVCQEYEDKLSTLKDSVKIAVTAGKSLKDANDELQASNRHRGDIIKQYEEENAALRATMREIYEVWAGSDGFDYNTYEARLVLEMRDLAAEWLKKGTDETT